jgi:hypothetical protein
VFNALQNSFRVLTELAFSNRVYKILFSNIIKFDFERRLKTFNFKKSIAGCSFSYPLGGFLEGVHCGQSLQILFKLFSLRISLDLHVSNFLSYFFNSSALSIQPSKIKASFGQDEYSILDCFSL